MSGMRSPRPAAGRTGDLGDPPQFRSCDLGPASGLGRGRIVPPMYWVLLITITCVVTLLITAAFGWRVFVAARGLLRELKTTAVLDEATALLSSAQEMDGVKALRARTQHD